MTVTVEAGKEPPKVATGVKYQLEDDSSDWHSFENTTKQWQLTAGESSKKTFEIDSPTAGEFALRLRKAVEGEHEVVEEWA